MSTLSLSISDNGRVIALKVGDAVTLRSRNASNLTASYPAVAAALRTLSAHRALLDGEDAYN